MKTLIYLFSILVFLLFSCKSTKLSDPDTSLLDKYWKLVELKNRNVQSVAKEPHLILRSEENRISGNGGCNSLFGNYALSKGNRIVFSNIGSTKMACDNMLEESAFFQALGATRSFAKQGNELFLKDSLGIDLLKFEHVEGKN